MENKLTFIVNEQKREFVAKKLINAGYTGRNKTAVEEHIKELKSMGIQAPDLVPCFFPKSPERMQTDGCLFPLDENCSSEAEFVVMIDKDQIFISVGSDVFDFKVEGLQADKSKWLYLNCISSMAWRYDEVKDHWDELILRSWIGKDRKTLYQEGTLSTMMRVEGLLEELKPYIKNQDLDGIVVYSGTIGCLMDGMSYTDFFEVELYDPVLKRSLNQITHFVKLDWFGKEE